MRDDVVQLARDPGALGGDRDLGLCLALLLQPGRALLQLREVGARVRMESPSTQARAKGTAWKTVTAMVVPMPSSLSDQRS